MQLPGVDALEAPLSDERSAGGDITMLGRVSGRPHRIEIRFVHHNGTVYLLSGGDDRSDWVRNIILRIRLSPSILRPRASRAAAVSWRLARTKIVQLATLCSRSTHRPMAMISSDGETPPSLSPSI